MAVVFVFCVTKNKPVSNNGLLSIPCPNEDSVLEGVWISEAAESCVRDDCNAGEHATCWHS